MPRSVTLFFRIESLDCSVVYLCVASFARALPSSKASFEICCALSNRSAAPAALRSEALRVISVIPMSSSTLMALVPLSSEAASPWTKAAIAPAASSWKACLNSAEDIPATEANCCSDSPPVSVASCMLTMTLENADPPASALMPTEERAAAKPMI